MGRKSRVELAVKEVHRKGLTRGRKISFDSGLGEGLHGNGNVQINTLRDKLKIKDVT